MKKILMLLALVGMMVACNENKPGNKDEGEDPIKINITDKTATSAYFTILPTDKEMAYMYGWGSKEEIEQEGTLAQFAQMVLNDPVEEGGFAYQDMIEMEMLHTGDIVRDYWNEMQPNSTYIVWAFHVSEDLKIVGKICSKEFTTPSAEQDPFIIQVEDITAESAYITIRPKDKETGYIFLGGTKDELEEFSSIENAVDLILYEARVYNVSYEEKLNDGDIHEGDLIRNLYEYDSSAEQTEQNIYVCHVSKELYRIGDFYTYTFQVPAKPDPDPDPEPEPEIPEGFVDLGLPSGTLWAIEININETSGSGGFYNFAQAAEAFPGQIPTASQFQELIDNTNGAFVENYTEDMHAYVFRRNEKELFLPARGFLHPTIGLISYGRMGSYMTCTSSDDPRTFTSMDFQYDLAEDIEYEPDVVTGNPMEYGLTVLRVYESKEVGE